MGFSYWKNEVADMPMQDASGKWFDAETGLRYEDYLESPTSESRKNLPKKTLEFRRIAKDIGGKALTGSRRQKEWAEKIRAEKIDDCSTQNQKEALVNVSISDIQKAKFWIENRDKSGRKIAHIILMTIENVALYHQHRKETNINEAIRLASQLEQFSV